MARRTSARRFAQAVFQIALEKEELDKWQTDLGTIDSLREDAAFMAVLENPKVPFDSKAKLLSERLGGIGPLALNLALLLVARGAIGIIGDIAAEYRRLVDAQRGIEPAEVITAVPLDEADKKKLAENLSAMVGKQVTLDTSVDPEILGGIIARMGGKLLDGSTRSRLAALKRELVGAEKKH